MSRPPRLAGFPYSGEHCYFLTFCTLDRARLLADPGLVGSALEYPYCGSDVWPLEEILNAVL